MQYPGQNGSVISDGKDLVSGFPDEMIEAIFAETLPQPLPHETCEDVMFSAEYSQQSIYLSHVSSRWRRLALAGPYLWPIRTGIHPDALAAFLARTSASGIVAEVRQTDFDVWRLHPNKVMVDALLDALAGSFPWIKVLHASVEKRSLLLRILELGRKASMV